MSFTLSINSRIWQLCALLLLNAISVVGQVFSGNLPDSNESPLERAKRARQEMIEKMRVEIDQTNRDDEALEVRIARLQRELTAAEAELARGDEVVPETTDTEISSGALVVISSDKSEGSRFIAEMRGRTFFNH